MDDREVRRRVAVVEERLGEIEALAEPARATAQAAIQELVELYGEALARLLALARDGGGSDASDDFDRAVAGDELLGHLLLLHDLHPETAGERVEAALVAMRPQLASRDARVELESIEGGVVRLRFAAAKPLPEALIDLFEEAVLAAAPEVERVEASGAVAEKGFVPLGALHRKERAG